jgi:hypothetical protein
VVAQVRTQARSCGTGTRFLPEYFASTHSIIIIIIIIIIINIHHPGLVSLPVGFGRYDGRLVTGEFSDRW